MILVRKKLVKGLCAEEIAELFEEEIGKIRKICDVLNENPEASEDEIVQLLMQK